MRKLVSVILMLFLGATVSFAASRTFIGEIMDGPCAKNGSHAAGYKMTGTDTPRECTLACVRAGAKFVLYNPDTKTIYKLDNQTEPRAFAGEIVKVIGTYNPSTKTIHVVKIEAVH